jgi:SAM-dependent methyltransferase
MLVTEPHLPATAPESNDLERRKALGQFFTPHDVAQFIWDMADLLRGKKLGRTARVIDPACGEGIFLRVAIERSHDADRCWGVDIDEALVPVWQADQRLRGTRLLRTNGLLDDPAIGLEAGTFDLVIGNPPFSGRGLKDLMQLVQPKGGKTRAAAPSLFGDIRATPSRRPDESATDSLSRDDRAMLDHLVRQLTRYACWRLRDETDDTVGPSRGSLFAELNTGSTARASDYERMAQDVAACPPDRLLDTSRPAVRNVIRRIAGTAIEVFFTERFVQLAKPGGMIAVIVPESILASDQLAPLRRWLMQQIQLLAVVGLPQKAFTGVGAKAKTGIIFARRYATAQHFARTTASAMLEYSDRLRNASILLTKPELKSTEFSLSEYLCDVLNSAKELASVEPPKENNRGS